MVPKVERGLQSDDRWVGFAHCVKGSNSIIDEQE